MNRYTLLIIFCVSSCQYISYNQVIPLARQAIIGFPDIELTEEYIAKHLFERLPYYEKAKKTIITDNKSIKSLVEEINLLLT